jgi:hypothetical protein
MSAPQTRKREKSSSDGLRDAGMSRSHATIGVRTLNVMRTVANGLDNAPLGHVVWCESSRRRARLSDFAGGAKHNETKVGAMKLNSAQLKQLWSNSKLSQFPTIIRWFRN